MLASNKHGGSGACPPPPPPPHIKPYSLILALLQVILYDTFGAERFRTFTSTYYRGSDAGLLMYSMEDQASLDYLYEEIKNAEHLVNIEDIVWAVVGNKSDLPSAVEEYRPRALCQLLDTELMFSTSAKTGENVRSAFERVIREVHQRRPKCTPPEKLNEDIHLLTKLPTQQKSCCSEHK